MLGWWWDGICKCALRKISIRRRCQRAAVLYERYSAELLAHKCNFLSAMSVRCMIHALIEYM